MTQSKNTYPLSLVGMTLQFFFLSVSSLAFAQEKSCESVSGLCLSNYSVQVIGDYYSPAWFSSPFIGQNLQRVGEEWKLSVSLHDKRTVFIQHQSGLQVKLGFLSRPLVRIQMDDAKWSHLIDQFPIVFDAAFKFKILAFRQGESVSCDTEGRGSRKRSRRSTFFVDYLVSFSEDLLKPFMTLRKWGAVTREVVRFCPRTEERYLE